MDMLNLMEKQGKNRSELSGNCNSFFTVRALAGKNLGLFETSPKLRDLTK